MAYDDSPENSEIQPTDSVAGRDEEFISQITRHQTSLLAYVHSIVPKVLEAEELLQRANLVLWTKRDKFEPGSNFKAWAFSVCRWEARAMLKQRKRQGWLVFDDELALMIGERMASIPDSDTDFYPEALRKCLALLSDKHRGLILERYEQGHSLKGCAERSGRSEGGLKVTLHRIRIELRRCITRQIQEGIA